MEALWPNRLPAAADTALSALLTKLRSVVGTEAVVGKQDVRLLLPMDTWIDLEAATEGLHRAESAVSQQDWARAWGPCRVTLHIALRAFLPGYEAPWVDDIRHQLDDALLRAHECVAASGLGLSRTRARIRRAFGAGIDQTRPVPRKRLPIIDGSSRSSRERRRGAVDVRATAPPATRGAWGKSGSQLRRPCTSDFSTVMAQARSALVRELKTVLFTDIVSSTERAAVLGDRAWRELLAHHHAIVREELGRFGGREIDTAGDGFLATFESPSQAVACACDIIKGVPKLGIGIRAGIHTGECEVLEGRVSGIAVHAWARIAATARPGELLVSSTVKDLVAGSGIDFDDRGAHVLRGVPGEWRLFAVHTESVPRSGTH